MIFLKPLKNSSPTIFILLLSISILIISSIPDSHADQMTTVSITAGSGSSYACETTNDCFDPAKVTVDVGGEVIWSNDDTGIAHTVTSGNPNTNPNGVGTLFDSGLFLTGKTFSHRFDQKGTYEYFCMVHPWMTGIIVVGEETEPIPPQQESEIIIQKPEQELENITQQPENIMAQDNTGIISLEEDPQKIAIDKSLNMAYVLQLDNISVIDLTTKKVVQVINVLCLQKGEQYCNKPGGIPWNIVIDSTVNKAYVTHPKHNTISVIDTKTNKIVTTFYHNSGDATAAYRELALGTETHQVYVIDNDGYALSIIDTRENKFVRNKIQLGVQAHAVYVEDKINRAYVLSNIKFDEILVIDTKKKQWISTIYVEQPYEMGIDYSTNRAYVTSANNVVHVINTQTNTIEKTIDLGLPAYFVRVDPLANRAYVMGYNNEKSGFDTIFVIDTKTNELVDKIKMEYGIEWMELDPLENRAYVVDSALPIIHIVTLPFQISIQSDVNELQCSGNQILVDGQCMDKESESSSISKTDRIIEERIPLCNKFMGIGCDTATIPMELVCSPKDRAEGKSGSQCTTFVETDEHYFQTKVLPVILGFVAVIAIIVISILFISKFVKTRNQRKTESVLLHNKIIDEYRTNDKLKNSLSDTNSKKHADPPNSELNVLKYRLASGEISKEEYDFLKKRVRK